MMSNKTDRVIFIVSDDNLHLVAAFENKTDAIVHLWGMVMEHAANPSEVWDADDLIKAWEELKDDAIDNVGYIDTVNIYS